MSLVVSALIVILADQVLKYIAFHLMEGPTVVFGFLKLSQVTNPGGAFGIGRSLASTAWGKYLLVFLSVAVVGTLLTLFARYCKTRFWARISVGLIVGGALSNLGDRFMFGYVRDFIDFTFWPAFNGADLAICAGVVVLIAGMLKEEKDRKLPRAAAPTPETPSSRQDS